MAGRETILNKATLDCLLEGFKIGATIRDTCDSCGVVGGTFFLWMQKGRSGEVPKGANPESPDYVSYVEFFERITQARVQARLSALKIIQKSITDGNVITAQWYLERSDPENWGRSTKLFLDVPPQLQRRLQSTADKANVDLAQLFEALVHDINGLEDAESE